MKSLILFDFDGTIADTLPLTVAAFNTVAVDFHLPLISSKDISRLKNLSASELLKEFPLSPFSLFRLIKKVRAEVKKELHKAPVFDGIPELLQNIKNNGSEIGIVTSNSRENVEYFLKNQAIDTVSFIQSEKNIFGKAPVLSRLIRVRQVKKDQAVYIGDEVRDIEAAQKVGIESIAVTWGFNSKQRLMQAHPTHLAQNPSEILSLLDR